MASGKALTKNDIKAILKEVGILTKKDAKDFATKKDLGQFATKQDLKNFATKDDFKGLKRLMNKNKREIMQAIANIATTSPTMKQFNELKDKVERYHPTN